MIPTTKEPTRIYPTQIDGVLPQNHPNFYGPLIHSFCLKLKPSILYILYNHNNGKRFCSFCQNSLSQENLIGLEVYWEWHSLAKINTNFTECHKCGRELIIPQNRAYECKFCIEEFLIDVVFQNKEVIVHDHS